jgi:hypothetical protein
MSSRPSWLPAEMDLRGEWSQILSRLYAVFDADFRKGKPRFRGLEVWWDRRILPGEQYEEGFWHLISRKNTRSGERLPDLARARRLTWCAPTILNADDSALKVWDYPEAENPDGTARKTRTYLWLEDLDYVVVLEKLSGRRAGSVLDVAFLVTAFVVDYERKRRQLRQKHARRCG